MSNSLRMKIHNGRTCSSILVISKYRWMKSNKTNKMAAKQQQQKHSTTSVSLKQIETQSSPHIANRKRYRNSTRQRIVYRRLFGLCAIHSANVRNDILLHYVVWMYLCARAVWTARERCGAHNEQRQYSNMWHILCQFAQTNIFISFVMCLMCVYHMNFASYIIYKIMKYGRHAFCTCVLDTRTTIRLNALLPPILFKRNKNQRKH